MLARPNDRSVGWYLWNPKPSRVTIRGVSKDLRNSECVPDVVALSLSGWIIL